MSCQPLTAQSQVKPPLASEPQLASHYIILIDTTTNKFQGWKKGVIVDLGSWIVKAVNAAINNTSVVKEPGFRPESDFVSLVFFHYPLDGFKITPGPYLFTAPDLLTLRDITNAKSLINNFLLKNKGLFKITPLSPIELTWEIVFPFVCGQLPSANNLPLPENHIGHIRLISIDDGISKNVNKWDFLNPEDWAQLERWQSIMNTNYTRSPLNKDVYYRFEENTGQVAPCENAPGNGDIYFSYFEITPRLENVGLKPNNTGPMDRYVREGDTGPDLILRGSDILLFSTGRFPGYLEWQDGDSSEPDRQWQKLLDTGAIPGEIGMFDYTIQTGDNKIPLQIDVPENIDNSFQKSYCFRGVLQVDAAAGEDIVYPFIYRYYTPPVRITCRVKDSIPVDNKTLISKMNDRKYLKEVYGFWNNDESLKKNHPGAVKSGRVVALSAGLVSEVARRIREHVKLKIMMSFAGLVGLSGLAFFALFFGRDPKLDVVLEKEPGQEAIVDFSRTDRKEIPVAALEIKNLRRISERRLKNEFSLELHFRLDTTLETPTQLKIKEGSGFSIKRNRDEQEFRLENDDNILKGILENIKVGDKFKLFFHANQVEDLTAPTPEAVETEFTITLIKAAGKYTESGKEVAMKPLDNGTGHEVQSKQQKIPVKFIPREQNTGIRLEPARDDHVTYCEEGKKHILPFSRKNPVCRVFSVIITNKNIISLSKKTEGVLTLEVKEEGDRVEQNPGFYLGKDKYSLDWRNEGVPINLSKGQTETVDCFVNFADLGENPVKSRYFYVQCKFNGSDFPGSAADVEIKRSDERTEALIALEVDGKPAVFKTGGKVAVDIAGRLLLDESIDGEEEIEIFAQVPGMKRIPVKEKGYTNLCTFEFTNGCSTGTGFYKWKLRKAELEKNTGINFDDGEDTSRFFTVDPINHDEGKVKDKENARDSFTLRLNHEPEHIGFQEYKLSLHISVDLDIVLYAGGVDEEEKNIHLKMNIEIEGFHDVLPHQMIVDFGSSAIAAAYYDFTVGHGGPGEPDRMSMQKLESSDGCLKGEHGFLPSIVNIVEGKTVGTADFLSLPLSEGIIMSHTERIISSLKLKILEGNYPFSIPTGLKCIDRDGKIQTVSSIPLEDLLISAYKNLKSNYLKKNPDTQKYIFTCPNIYTKSHQAFLLKILSDVFADRGHGVYKENIQLVSESDAVLFYYIKRKAGKEPKQNKETAAIFDIGASTMDITLGEIQWTKEKDRIKVKEVKIKNRDGMAMAGEILDKAIAYQVHDVLKEYDSPVENTTLNDENSQAANHDNYRDNYQEPENEFKEDFDHDTRLTANKTQDKELLGPVYDSGNNMKSDNSHPGEMNEESSKTKISPENPAEKTNENPIKKHYVNCVVKGNNEAGDFKSLMFNFKNDNILQFKKDIVQAADDSWVEICLGENNGTKGLIANIKGKEDRQYRSRWFTVNTHIEHRNGKCYLGMIRKDWLNLPYIKRFKELFEEKIKKYRESVGRDSFKNAVIILSGRASLWPSIPEAIKNILGVEPVDIWPTDEESKSSALKRAVIEGAIYKVIYLNHIPFERVEANGFPAVSYEKSCNEKERSEWNEIRLTPGHPVEVDLYDSPYFKIGIQTALEFLPFMECENISRDNLIDKNTTIKIHTRESGNDTGYDFLVQSDRYPEPTLLVIDPQIKGHFSNISRTNWPIADVQLPPIKPEDFNEHV